MRIEDESEPYPTLPRVERYLRGLPSGLASHPGALARGALVRTRLEGFPRADLLPVLPRELRRLVLDPPMATDWVPEVHLVALTYAVADVHGLEDEALVSWVGERNRALAVNPAYQILMTFSLPEQLLRFVGARWSSWHQGSSLEVRNIGPKGGELHMRFPPGLFDLLAHQVLARIFAVMFEQSRASRPTVVVEAATDDTVRFRAGW